MSMDGAASVGYAGGGGSGAESNSINLGGDANLNGSYHDPRFLTFNVAPRYMWNNFGGQNAAASSLTNDGLTSSLRFLSGGNMPLTFQYNLSNVTSSTLSGGTVPLTVSSRGISDDYSVNWSPHFARLPSLSLNYAWGSSNSSTNGEQSADFVNTHSIFTAISTYKLLGFYLTGFYSLGETESRTPDLLNLGVPQNTGETNQQSEGFGVSRALPVVRGQTSFSYEHSDSETSTLGTPQGENFQTMSATFSTSPLPRLQMGFGAAYSSNYGAQLLTELLTQPAGTTPTQTFIGTGRDTNYDASATYQIRKGFYFVATAQQENSNQPGEEQLTIDQVTAGLSYTHALFRGILSVSYTPGIQEVSVSVPGESASERSLLQMATAAYQRRVGRWQTQESFQYSHSGFTQSLTIPIVAESIAGSARASTRLKYRWNFSVGGSLIDQRVPGMNGTFSKEVDVRLSTRSWSATGQYQQNSGYAILTTSGILSVGAAAASTLLATQYTDTTTLACSGSYTRRRLQLTGTYAWVNVNFDAASGPVTNKDSTLDARLVYKFRKIDVQAGFRRLSQFADSNSGLNMASHTYWISLVRRFHAF
jgi:hypothetical protein